MAVHRDDLGNVYGTAAPDAQHTVDFFFLCKFGTLFYAIIRRVGQYFVKGDVCNAGFSDRLQNGLYNTGFINAGIVDY
ncbi:hypothetical protein SDC9_206151 [bioreactor metagenome]|uniref:Uncharacterized protein n=1 Tax=bioreactor metagenome TaxID=1076179 RepID=A0A645J4S6_9ZZZZ